MKIAIGIGCVALLGVGISMLATAQIVKVAGISYVRPDRKDKVVLTDKEWQKRLSREQYEILRAKGTEPAFCGVNLEGKGPGIYHCVGCDLPLFDASHKFDSGTGWPSYYKPIRNDAVWFQVDRGYGMVRTEILCARCDGHLGHVFDQQPTPNGLRYCLNGKVLKFVPAKKEEEKKAKAKDGEVEEKPVKAPPPPKF